MDAVLQTICGELDQLATQIISAVPNDEPFNVAHNNWSFPGITRKELAHAASSLSDLIRDRGQDELGENAQLLQDYPRRLQFLRMNMPQNIWGNAAVAVPSYFATLDALRVALDSALKSDTEVARSVRQSAARVRAMEARLNDIEPRSAGLEVMVERIERAYHAADQLPTDLQSLEEARQKITKILGEAERDQRELVSVRLSADELDAKLKNSAEEASAIIARLDLAYSAATSQGLAAAFAERSGKLDLSMWIWVGGLIVALGLGAFFGARRLQNLIEILTAPGVSESVIFLNLLLSLLSVGGPIWFGWLATKQIGQRFRLSEDYAFKASVSRAYEGYRREAARIDADLEARLLASALTRLDEQPLRLVESSSYGSPFHELASSDLVREAIKSVPAFSGNVIDLARGMLNRRETQTAEEPAKPTGPAA